MGRAKLHRPNGNVPNFCKALKDNKSDKKCTKFYHYGVWVRRSFAAISAIKFGAALSATILV
jgi:hypothetical protein